MLKSLLIKNYALISDAEIEFQEGLNVLTGETGAGKSILIAALGTILGDRVDTTVLREGAQKAIVEGCFQVSGQNQLINFLREHEIADPRESLFLRREILQNGRTRAFINDTPVQLNILQTVGDFLVDLHGQHEHQSLLKEKQHLAFLDAFGDLEAEVMAVAEAHREIQSQVSTLNRLESKQKESEQKRVYLKFQIDEIEKFNPDAAEEEELVSEEKKIQHSERLFELTNRLKDLLYEREDSVFDQLNQVISSIEELEKIDDSASKYREECHSAKLIVEELAKAFQSYNSAIEFSPDRLEIIHSRLLEISGFKKKYQKTLSEIADYHVDLKKEFDGYENLGSEISDLKGKILEQKTRFGELCLTLSEHRKQAAGLLEEAIPSILAHLGMSGSRFNVAFESQDDPNGYAVSNGHAYLADEHGIDIAKFYLSTNAGESLKPLVKVASGGEISRIMLALKSILAKQGQIPVLIFDEIDNGVSGRIAQAVGKKLKELSKFHQVICITHLPQIASMGTNHYLVEKSKQDGRTHSMIRKISNRERTEAIARLLAGETISESHLNSARELLQDAEAN